MTIHSDYLKSLIEKIERNPEADFGGAFIIVPPEGDPVQGLFIGQNEPGLFWASVKTKIEQALDAIDTRQRQGYR